MARHIVLIPAAGGGARFGSAVPKQYAPLAGVPVLAARMRIQRSMPCAATLPSATAMTTS